MLHPRRLPSVGELDTLITIQSRVLGTNVSNEDEETGWQDVIELRAARADKAGVLSWEAYRGDKLTTFLDSVFIIRYRTDITTAMRIICGTLIYDIKAIGEIGRRRYLTITAETGGTYKETTT